MGRRLTETAWSGGVQTRGKSYQYAWDGTGVLAGMTEQNGLGATVQHGFTFNGLRMLRQIASSDPGGSAGAWGAVASVNIQAVTHDGGETVAS